MGHGLHRPCSWPVSRADGPADDERGRKGDSSNKDGHGASRTTSDCDFEDDVTMLRGYSFLGNIRNAPANATCSPTVARGLGHLGQWQKQFIISLDAALPNGDYEK